MTAVARAVGERLRAAVPRVQLPAHEGGPTQVTASGQARPHPGDSSESLHARADQALHAARRAGRDRLVDDQETPAAPTWGLPPPSRAATMAA